MSVNKAIIVGYLGRDPELKHTKGGTAVCTLSVATSEKWTKDGESQESTEWHRIVVWGKQAEACDRYLSKGRQVYIEGKVQTREWEDRDGNVRHTTEINAQVVEFLSGGKGGDEHSRDDAPPPLSPARGGENHGADAPGAEEEDIIPF